MEITKKVEELVDKVVDVICDRCGKTCKDEINLNFEFAEVKAMWGYGSNKDLERHKIHLCEPCYDETLKTMGIKPQISHYM